MEIKVREDTRLVEIWLTNAEKQDADLRKQLKPLYQEYYNKKYLVAVFQSGGHDLADATADLLCHNRKRLAEAAARQEKQQGTVMGMEANCF